MAGSTGRDPRSVVRAAIRRMAGSLFVDRPPVNAVVLPSVEVRHSSRGEGVASDRAAEEPGKAAKRLWRDYPARPRWVGSGEGTPAIVGRLVADGGRTVVRISTKQEDDVVRWITLPDGRRVPIRGGRGVGPSRQEPSRAAKPDESGVEIVRTSDVEVALRALQEGKKVELEQPRQVAVLLDRMAAIAREAEVRGERAPNYNLCDVIVKGTNLFCVEAKGVERVRMPQLSGKPLPGSLADKLPKDSRGEVDIGPAFLEYLRAKGAKVTDEEEDVSYLRPTQNELNGVKVAKLMRAHREGTLGEAARSPLFISRDNYIVDGHHRWAANIGLEFVEGKDITMRVYRVDMGIIELLGEAHKFARRMGLPTVSWKALRIAMELVAKQEPIRWVTIEGRRIPIFAPGDRPSSSVAAADAREVPETASNRLDRDTIDRTAAEFRQRYGDDVADRAGLWYASWKDEPTQSSEVLRRWIDGKPIDPEAREGRGMTEEAFEKLYEFTQEKMAEAGVPETVILYRGLSGKKFVEEVDRAVREGKDEVYIPLAHARDGGVGFSANRYTARSFADGSYISYGVGKGTKSGIVFRTAVPREAIVAADAFAPRNVGVRMGENEYIVATTQRFIRVKLEDIVHVVDRGRDRRDWKYRPRFSIYD